MERLRAIVARLGWKDVSTLGASGNVLYTAGRKTAATDAAQLADAVAREMGRPATVIVRSHADLKAVIDAEPFANTDTTAPTKWWFVGFLADKSKGALPEIPGGAPISYAGRLPREVCWTMSAPHLRAIDFPKRIEKALGLPMTVRNWNVANRIAGRLAEA